MSLCYYLCSRRVFLDGVVPEALKHDDMQSVRLIRHLLQSLEKQHLTTKQDMLLAARRSPLHGNMIHMFSNVNVACRTAYVLLFMSTMCV